jgi:hypothetical protein
MLNDPVVAEVHEVRRKLAMKHGNNLGQILAALKKPVPGHTYVSVPVKHEDHAFKLNVSEAILEYGKTK